MFYVSYDVYYVALVMALCLLLVYGLGLMVYFSVLAIGVVIFSGLFIYRLLEVSLVIVVCMLVVVHSWLLVVASSLV